MTAARLSSFPKSCACVALLAVLGTAQTGLAQQPLSAIDWLGTRAAVIVPAPQPTAPATPKVDEPPVTKSALVPQVSVQSLTESGPRLIGLVPAQVTGLAPDLWQGSDLDSLERLIAELPDFDLPALQSLFYTVLLAEALPPAGISASGDTLALARVNALVRQGALDPAQALIEQTGITLSAAHFDAFMQISLLTGNEDRACAQYIAAPHLSDDYGVRIFCQGRTGLWEDAALTFGSAQALGLLPADTLALLSRYLDPEIEGTLPAAPDPRTIDPLGFRLWETIGEPVATATLPRRFAVADLRDVAGWKAQVEAAERLTRASALPDNRLLGLYTDRRPAASGGVWERVQKLQQFDTALTTKSSDAVAKTLPAVWRAMGTADLQVTFANLFADRLAGIALTGSAALISQTVQLLSAQYETAARKSGQTTLAARIAMGDLPGDRPDTIIDAAVYDAFASTLPRTDLTGLVAQRRLGEAILQSLSLVHDGTRGNTIALSEGLATLRALGLEDTARRAALQLLLLEG